MNFDLQKTLEIIKNNKDFLKLKNVIEDNVSHHGETSFEHCIQTLEKAQELITGNLITNDRAKKKFNDFINQEIDGIKKKDLLLIIALIHDCGKMIILDGKPLQLTPKKPGHGYWGSLLVPGILQETGLSETAIVYIANCVKLHLAGAECWSLGITGDELLWQLKLRAENFHAEMIFNIYCDLFYNKTFQDKIHLPLELLNDPQTYERVEYSIEG